MTDIKQKNIFLHDGVPESRKGAPDSREGGWGVLFDLYGVLIDSEREYTRIWNRINQEFPSDVPNLAEKIKGTTLENILNTYYPDPETRRNVERRLLEEEAKMVYDYCPGAKALLDDLKSSHVPMALFTSSNDIKMAHLYRDLPGIRDYFDVIITGDMVSRSKPDPQGYLMAADALGLPHDRCVVVEDALQGVKAGHSAGGAVLGVAGTLSAEVLAPYSTAVTTTLENIDASYLRKLIG